MGRCGPAPFGIQWDWYINSFQIARDSCNKYCPNAKLILNDDWLSADNQGTTDFISIANALKSRNLIDGIGDQCHFYETADINVVRANLDRLAATGLPIYISELDFIGDEQTQLGYYKKWFPLFWDHPGIKGITLWGYQEGRMWRDGHIMNADGSWHPALTYIVDYMKTHGGATGVEIPLAARTAYEQPRVLFTHNGFTLTSGREATVRIFDMKGTQVFAARASSGTPVGLGSLPYGSFAVRIEADGRQIGKATFLTR